MITEGISDGCDFAILGVFCPLTYGCFRELVMRAKG